MKTNEDPVVVEQTYRATAETVWNAITRIDQMRCWYFDNIPSFEPVVGFKTQFDVQCEDRHFLHLWSVTEVEPLKRIKYDWRYDGYAGDSCVVFELSERDGATSLRLTHEVRESFPEEIPEFRRDSCVAGWKYFINDRLKAYLETDS